MDLVAILEAVKSLVSPDVFVWLQIVAATVASFAVAAAHLPVADEKSSAFYRGFRSVVDWIGQNYKNAKNVS